MTQQKKAEFGYWLIDDVINRTPLEALTGVLPPATVTNSGLRYVHGGGEWKTDSRVRHTSDGGNKGNYQVGERAGGAT